MTRILIADDHEVVRAGLRAILGAHEGWEVVGEAANGKEAISKSLETKPDVVIMQTVRKRRRIDMDELKRACRGNFCGLIARMDL